MNSTDDFLDAVAGLLAASSTVPELTGDNTLAWLHGASDPDEDIKRGSDKCQGVSALIFDMGGDSDPDDADSPVILSEVMVELYVDTTKRNRRKTPSLRSAGAIRDAIMRTLHLAPQLIDGEHCHMEPKVRGYRPIQDPDYVVFRIRLERPILLA